MRKVMMKTNDAGMIELGKRPHLPNQVLVITGSIASKHLKRNLPPRNRLILSKKNLTKATNPKPADNDILPVKLLAN